VVCRPRKLASERLAIAKKKFRKLWKLWKAELFGRQIAIGRHYIWYQKKASNGDYAAITDVICPDNKDEKSRH